MTDDEKQQEESKRDRNWDPQMRWQAIQATITWADAQQTARRNTRAGALEEQTQRLRELRD
jgi:hypothetical protein